MKKLKLFLALNFITCCLFAQMPPFNITSMGWRVYSSYLATSNAEESEANQSIIKVYSDDTLICSYKNDDGCYFSAFILPHIMWQNNSLDPLVVSGLKRIYINDVDTVYDFTILNDSIFFSGWSISANKGVLGIISISEIVGISFANTGTLGSYILSYIDYKIKKIESFFDGLGGRHVVGIGTNQYNDDYFFHFFISTGFYPNFSINSPGVYMVGWVCQPRNFVNIKLYDIAITDNYVSIVGVNNGNIPSNNIILFRSSKNSVNNFTYKIFDHSSNILSLLPITYDTSVLIRHTYDDEIVILANGFDTSSSNYMHRLVIDCIDMNTFTDIYLSKKISLEEKDLLIKDAIYNNQDSVLLILAEGGVIDNDKRNYVIHAKPYSNLSTYEFRYTTTLSSVFNSIDLLGYHNKYITFGATNNGKGLSCIAVQKIDTLTNCFENFFHSVINTIPIQYNTDNFIFNTDPYINPYFDLFNNHSVGDFLLECSN
ncbi:MAG: hypothetical protein HUK18_01020 [Bacteroidales bacterium]|nr:hypothetical protein [Bacteroidales bacterium]